jgi:hypothetical protein
MGMWASGDRRERLDVAEDDWHRLGKRPHT